MSEQKNWLDFAEIGAAGLSLVGAAASAVGQSCAYATIPLSLSVTLNLLNRKRLLGEVVKNHRQDISALQESLTTTQQALNQDLEQHKQDATTELNHVSHALEGNLEQLRGDLTQSDTNLQESLQSLDQEHRKLADLVGQLQKIENFSQAIRANPDCGEFYYQRGLGHQNLGDKEGAIADYTQAIRTEPNHPGAHHQRGILQAELGNRRQAVEDLRRAAKLYFEQGDVDSYQQARDLSKEFHEIHTPVVEEGGFERIKIRNFLA